MQIPTLSLPHLAFLDLLGILINGQRGAYIALRGKTEGRLFLGKVLEEPSAPCLVFRSFDGRSHLIPFVDNELALHPDEVVGEVFLGVGAWEGRGWGFVRPLREDEAPIPVRQLYLPGPGLARVPLVGGPSVEAPFIDRDVYSRTLGALGPDGGLAQKALQNLSALQVTLVGGGRMGAQVGRALNPLFGQIQVIDPDRLESHSLPETGYPTSGVGRPKAEVLVGELETAAPNAGFGRSAHVLPLECREGSRVARSGDLIVTCVDHDSPRIAAALLANLYQQIHLDVASGIRFSADGDRILGAEIRLMLPGDGCLNCRGGLVDKEGALANLRRFPADRMRLREEADWDAERSGSLGSLNAVAANLACRLLEDLATGRIQRSTWLRVEWGESGIPSVREPQWSSEDSRNCPYCRELGRGDSALGC